MTEGRDVVELVGVYHAEGSLRGELAYVLGKLVGRAHCALCDITHGTLRRKPAFDRCAATLPAPITLVHLDERDPDVLAASEGRTPCVLARRADGTVDLLVDADALDRCEGSPERLVQLVVDALSASGR